MMLPLNTYTQWYWKIDLNNLMHFLALRADPHAQYEIRAYADVMIQIRMIGSRSPPRRLKTTVSVPLKCLHRWFRRAQRMLKGEKIVREIRK